MARKSENTGQDRAKQAADRGFGFAQAPGQAESASAQPNGGMSQEAVAEAAAIGAAVAEAGTLGAAAAILGAAEEDTRFASALATTITPRLETISANLSMMSRSLEGMRDDSKRSPDNYARIDTCVFKDSHGNVLKNVVAEGDYPTRLTAYNGDPIVTRNDSKLRNVFVTNIDREVHCCVPIQAKYLPMCGRFDYFDVNEDALVQGLLAGEDKALGIFVESVPRVQRAVEKSRASRCPDLVDITERELVYEFVVWLTTVFEIDQIFRKFDVAFDRRCEHLHTSVREAYVNASARAFVEKYYGSYIRPFSFADQPRVAPWGQAARQCPVWSYVPTTDDEIFYLDCDGCCGQNEIDYRPATIPQPLRQNPLAALLDVLGRCRDNSEALEQLRAQETPSIAASESAAGYIPLAISYNLPAGITFGEQPAPTIQAVGADGKVTAVASPDSSASGLLVYNLPADMEFVQIQHPSIHGVDAQGDPVVGVPEQNTQLFSRSDVESGRLNAGVIQIDAFAEYRMDAGGRSQVMLPSSQIIDNGATFLSRLPAIPVLTMSNGAVNNGG